MTTNISPAAAPLIKFEGRLKNWFPLKCTTGRPCSPFATNDGCCDRPAWNPTVLFPTCDTQVRIGLVAAESAANQSRIPLVGKVAPMFFVWTVATAENPDWPPSLIAQTRYE